MAGYMSGLLGIVPILVVYILWRLYCVRKRFKLGLEVSAPHEAGWLLLVVFFFELATISLTPADFSMFGTGFYPAKVNALPFSTVGPIFAQEGLSLNAKLMAIASPYLAYIAFGLLIPFVMPRLATYRRTISVSVLIAICLELLQLLETVLGVSVKTFTFDDVLFAAVAASIGYLLFVVARSVIRRYNPDFRRLDFYEPEDGEYYDDDDEWNEYGVTLEDEDEWEDPADDGEEEQPL